MGIGGGRAGIGGPGHGGLLALILDIQILVQQSTGLIEMIGLVGQLGLHEQKVEVLGRAARHGRQLCLGTIIIDTLGHQTGQHQLQFARIGVARDERARGLFGARWIDAGAVFEHALRGRFRARVGRQGGARLAVGTREIPRGLRHIGQSQMRSR